MKEHPSVAERSNGRFAGMFLVFRRRKPEPQKSRLDYHQLQDTVARTVLSIGLQQNSRKR